MAKTASAKKIKRPKPPKSTKKGSAAEIEKLKQTVRLLKKNVAKAEKKADGFKSELKKLRAEAATKAKKAKKSKKAKPSADVIAEHDVPEPPVEVVPMAEAPTSELTVAQLRAAAREQGVAGYSRMRKEQLIDALS